MQFRFLRPAVAVMAVAALAACAGQAVVPSQPAQSNAAQSVAASRFFTAVPFGGDGLRSPQDQCNLGTGTWYFKGACASTTINKNGTTVKMPAVSGETVTIVLQKSDAAANTTFVFGAGTSLKNITGTFQNVKFPLYGTVGCYNLQGQSATCTGKGFYYLEAVNYSTSPVKFNGTPTMTITGKFPGSKKCEADLLLSGGSGTFGWGLAPIYGKPANGKVTLPKTNVPFSFGGHTFAIIAFTCQ